MKAWLIEFPGPLWLGIGWHHDKGMHLGLKLVHAERAIRFVRYEDAFEMLEGLKAEKPDATYDRATVTEHEFE